VDVSAELISKITDDVIEEVREWWRPLDRMHPILYLDALRINSRQDAKTVNKAVFLTLGINMEGRRDFTLSIVRYL